MTMLLWRRDQPAFSALRSRCFSTNALAFRRIARTGAVLAAALQVAPHSTNQLASTVWLPDTLMNPSQSLKSASVLSSM